MGTVIYSGKCKACSLFLSRVLLPCVSYLHLGFFKRPFGFGFASPDSYDITNDIP